MSQHCVVALTHHKAHIYHLDGKTAGDLSLKESSVRETNNRHVADGKKADHKHFFEDVAKALTSAKEILIVGNGTAKDEFKHHLEHHHKNIAAHVVAVESIDHPTEPQLLAMAKKKFKTIDAWLGDNR
jgi:stalled ribosome rescue protein Dom34